MGRSALIRFLLAAVVGVSWVATAPKAIAQEVTPREIAVVIRVSMPPAFDTSGRMIGSASGRAAELASRLATLRREDLAAVPFALTFPGVLCDELRLMNTSASRRLLRELRSHARSSPVLATTYADVRLSDVTSAELKREVSDGEDAIRACTGIEPRRLFVPPDLTLSTAEILERLRRAGAVVALSAHAVPPATDRPTIVPAFELDDDAGVDGVLEARPESPSIALVIDVASRDASSVLTKLAEDERIALRDVNALARLDVIRGVIDTAPSAPAGYRRAIERASTALERFRSITLPDNHSASVYEIVLARARSSAEWNPDYAIGSRRADALTETISQQLRLVSVPNGSVTFTSRRGSIPVTVASRAAYPVRVRVQVSSPKLGFPGGAARVVTIEPPGDTITFDAVARSTGTFPTTVIVASPRRTLTLARGELTVRSTAANLSALLLTGGGAAFLFAWAVRRMIRRRSVGRDA